MTERLRTVVKFRRDTYEHWTTTNPIISEGEIIVITNLPWYKSWFGLKPARLKLGDGITCFNKLKYL
jgi:hypothetical protein